MVAPLVLSYYVVLRSVLRLKPWLRKCLARCRHCGIFFLTDVRNAGRQDLGCPFGCRQAHRRRQSTRRSVDYYRQPEGKTKKRALNAQRRKTPAPPAIIEGLTRQKRRQRAGRRGSQSSGGSTSRRPRVWATY